MSKKIAIIGAGRSGTDTIYMLAERKILTNQDELVIVDISDRAKGAIGETKTAFEDRGLHPKITPINALNKEEIDKLKDVDIVVFCASAPFPTGGFKSRDWAMYKNSDIVSMYAPIIGKQAPNAFVIMDSNPLDVMTAQFYAESGLKPHQVMGKGGDLDTQRLHSLLSRTIAKKIVSPDDLTFGDVEEQIFEELRHSHVAMAGIHSEGEMIPIIPVCTEVKGKKIVGEWLNDKELQKVIVDAKAVGPKSSRYLTVGSPSKGGAKSNVDLIEKLFSPTPSQAYISAPIWGKYGLPEGNDDERARKLYENAFSCTRCIISDKGIEEITEIPELKKSPAMVVDFVDGVLNAKEKLKKIECYQAIKAMVGALPPIEAIVCSEGTARFRIKPPLEHHDYDISPFVQEIGRLAANPKQWKIDASAEFVEVEYPDASEIQSLAALLQVESTLDIDRQIEAAQGTLADLEAKKTRFGGSQWVERIKQRKLTEQSTELTVNERYAIWRRLVPKLSSDNPDIAFEAYKELLTGHGVPEDAVTKTLVTDTISFIAVDTNKLLLSPPKFRTLNGTKAGEEWLVARTTDGDTHHEEHEAFVHRINDLFRGLPVDIDSGDIWEGGHAGIKVTAEEAFERIKNYTMPNGKNLLCCLTQAMANQKMDILRTKEKPGHEIS